MKHQRQLFQEIAFSIYKIANAYVKDNFFVLPRNWIYLLQNYFSSYLYLRDMYTTLKGIEKTQFVFNLCLYHWVFFGARD